jgi:hypothetical protein
MKKILFTLFIIYSFALNAQRTDYDWKKWIPNRGRKSSIIFLPKKESTSYEIQEQYGDGKSEY